MTAPRKNLIVTALPLKLRLPNPPPIFVGRDKEMEALVAALQRSPVAVVSGPAGIGKTALALQALRRLAGFAEDRALHIGLRSGPTAPDPRAQIMRAIAVARGLDQADWSGVLADEETFGTALLDLAESDDCWILLDDLHHMEASSAASLLGLLARYARRSHWVVTSQAHPRLAELRPQLFALDGLADGALAELAAVFAPTLGAEELRGAIQTSGGSPSRLLHTLASPEGAANSLRPRDPSHVVQRDPDAALAGARLRLVSGDIEGAVATLDAEGERLLESGRGHQLWQLLESPLDRRLAPWRLRCAVALAHPALLAQLELPPQPTPEEQLLWAQGLLERHCEGALELATSVEAAALQAEDRSLALKASLVRVESLCNGQSYREARALLAELEPAEAADSRALHESWVVYCLAATDQHEEASRRLQVLQRRAADLSGSVRTAVGFNLARTMSLLGRPRDAYEAVKSVAASSLQGAKCLSLQLVVAMELGRLGEAAQHLRDLDQFQYEGSTLRHSVAVRRAHHQLCTGELRACEETISYWKPALQRLGDVEYLRALNTVETGLRMLRAEPPPAHSDEDPALDGSALYSLHWQARAGQSPAEGLKNGQAGAGDSQKCRLLADVAVVAALLAQGNAAAALQLCARLLGELHQFGWGALHAEVEQMHCDILLVLGRWDELTQATRALERHADEMPSPRLKGEARFFAAVLPPHPLDWGQLEQLATQIDTAPIGARRARVLLGGESPLDAIDRRILAALREKRGIAPCASLSAWAPHKPPEPRAREQPGWGLADDERRVWLPSGASISLADRPQLWSILVALHELGGTATKEQLVQAIWHEAEYHPLHHDNRLQVAIRKLRKVIEDEPSRPTRLVTLAEGYTLVGHVRRSRTLALSRPGPTDTYHRDSLFSERAAPVMVSPGHLARRDTMVTPPATALGPAATYCVAEAPCK